MLQREGRAPTALSRVGDRAREEIGAAVRWAWGKAVERGAIGPNSRAGRRFGHLGQRSVLCFPVTALVNERYIHIGDGTMIGPNCSLSAGMVLSLIHI